MKITGVAGVGAMTSPMAHLAEAMVTSEATASKVQHIPTRPFGESGIDISILGLGGALNFMSNQLLLRQAINMGVTCWDTSRNYIGGKSEKGIGKYFTRFPDDRDKVFLVTKTGQTDPDNMTQDLYESLQKMKTRHIDLFLIQAVSNARKELKKEIRVWADKARANGTIRFFGFSTHKNMENCLFDAAKMGWIDGILTTYNYRLMHTDRMKKAVEACTEAGIGLIAMKTQASLVANLYSDLGKETDAAKRLNQRFTEKGFTTEQAKLKSVWENPAIASICSHMPNLKLVQANVAAATNKSALSIKDKQLMDQYASETAFGYCSGCAAICEQALGAAVPISNIMRYLMYQHSYRDRQLAIRLFNDLPIESREQILQVNYLKAEKRCPQRMPIAYLMRKAASELGC